MVKSSNGGRKRLWFVYLAVSSICVLCSREPEIHELLEERRGEGDRENERKEKEGKEIVMKEIRISHDA